MKNGHWVTHRYFSEDEHITYKDGKVMDENGYRFGIIDFWSDRVSKAFDEEWSIKNFNA